MCQPTLGRGRGEAARYPGGEDGASLLQVKRRGSMGPQGGPSGGAALNGNCV